MSMDNENCNETNWENGPNVGDDIFISDEEENSSENGIPWLKTILNTYRKYKNEFFAGGSNTCITRERSLDHIIKPNYKFVFAKYKDGLYRPGSIVGKSKKLKLFIIYFYHNKKCNYVKTRDIFLKHGNLLDRRVSFFHEGRKKKGTVYGNNSPANRGFPSLFFVKKQGRHKWYIVNFRHIFLTKNQVLRIHFISRKCHQCDCYYKK